MNIQIVIATYNRQHDINRLFYNLVKQSYHQFSVLIIDDHSPIPITLPEQDKRFSILRSDQNYGQSKSRNFAIKKSQAEVLIFLDDDAEFLSRDALNHVAQYFKANCVAGLQFDILEPERELLSARRNLSTGEEIAEFIACGCAFNLQILKETGGFNELLHSYGEESDLALRLIDKGYIIHFSKEVMVYHNYSPLERNRQWHKRFIKNSTRNDLIIAFINFPSTYLLYFLVGKIVSRLKFAVHYLGIPAFISIAKTLEGILEFLTLLPRLLKERNPVKSDSFMIYLEKRFK